VFLALVVTASAADVTGKWVGTYTITGADGAVPETNPAVVFLKQTGSTLTGTAGQDEGEQFPIENAKIADNKITGTVNPSDGNTYAITLTANGDRMTGEIVIGAGGQTIKAKIELKRAQ
jgi:uncharacterized protein (DUF2147 family)